MTTKMLWLASAMLFFGACRQQKAECGFGTQPGPWALRANWTACSDGQSRSVECQRGESAFRCQCMLASGGAPEKAIATFTLPSLSSLEDRESATRTANELCKWGLE